LATRKRTGPPQPFSFIRTLTVGFGITPNLLTLPPEDSRKNWISGKKALAGLGYPPLPPVGNFTPP
jgi:hypothetical protein